MKSNTLSKATKTLGFGFSPEDTHIHFLVDVSSKENTASIYDRSQWKDGVQKIDHRFDVLKVKLSLQKWDKLKSVFATEFNNRLRESKRPVGKWAATKTPVHRLLGKEMMVLAWAVADCDPTVIETAIKNWLGLRPEERWWLYTMANSTSGGVDDNFGWRKALRYALTENPVMDSERVPTLFSSFKDDEL